MLCGWFRQGYQQPVHLFGRKKGSGESVWDTKKKLGLLSTEFHMECVSMWRRAKVVRAR